MEAALNIVEPPVETPQIISAEEYLREEELSDVRHEFIGGRVFAMAGNTQIHSVICCNLIIALGSRLRGGPCRVFEANMKVRFSSAEEDGFYYPDVTVSCAKLNPADRFISEPKVIFEVLSDSTERIDRVEKFHYYTQIASLEHYVLVTQNRMQMTLFSRANNWTAEILKNANDGIALKALNVSLPISEIYQDVPLK